MTGPTRRAVVVEDESAQRLMYTKALASFGFDVVSVESGAGAMRALDAGPVGVVLLDLNLAGEHGLDLFEQIRERHPAVSIVIATGYGTFSLAKQAIRMDVVDFLSKPVSLSDLESAMSRAWSRHVLVQTPVADLLPPLPAGKDLDFDMALDSLVSRSGDLNLESMEKSAILEALRRCGDNRKAAAQMLGISERTLYYRLTRYRIRMR
jgi:DNA-binding NtrC family response regulator